MLQSTWLDKEKKYTSVIIIASKILTLHVHAVVVVLVEVLL